LNVLTRVENLFLARLQQVRNTHAAFFVDDHRVIKVIHFHIEDSALDRDHRRRRADLVEVRLPARVLNLDSNLAQPHFQQIDQVETVGVEDNARFREYLESAAVRHLEHAVALRSGHDHL